MKTLLRWLVVVFVASFLLTFSVLLLCGATPGQALEFMATAGYTVQAFELSTAIAALCLGGTLIAGVCLHLIVLCAAIYGIAWVAGRGWIAGAAR